MTTIFAQSSKPGKAGVAVFRISGPGSLDALKQLLLIKELKISPRIMYPKKIYEPKTGQLIDHAMIVYFKAPSSFTGEDVVEIHTHGSIAITKILYSALLTVEGLRIAAPGEFAKRAFLNGKFDLTSAEGMADLIEAETVMQHKQAIRQMGGELERLYSKWRQQLLKVISLLEAYIDFPDEDIPIEVLTTTYETVSNLKNDILKHLNDNRRGELIRNGIKLTILGLPNAGKSSLLNFLMQREMAIVSDIAGTTRDVIEGHLDIGGYAIIVQDTAGIRNNSSDLIEQEGIRRAIESAKNADIKIIMLDAANMEAEANNIITGLIDNNTILVVNKVDLLEPGTAIQELKNRKPLLVSLKECWGLKELLREIETVAANIAKLDESPAITQLRHRRYLEQAVLYLANFNIEQDLVLAAEDVRMTIRALAHITGLIEVEEIIGEIFSKFCIGK